MTRPDPTIRPMIQLLPIADSPKDPNDWRLIAAAIFLALGMAVAVQF